MTRPIFTKPSQREAYDRRPAESSALTFEEYTERAPMPVTRAVAVLVDGVRFTLTGRQWQRRDGLGFPYVEAEAVYGRQRVRVIHSYPATDHAPARAGAMLLYPPTISDVEGMDAVTWRAA